MNCPNDETGKSFCDLHFVGGIFNQDLHFVAGGDFVMLSVERAENRLEVNGVSGTINGAISVNVRGLILIGFAALVGGLLRSCKRDIVTVNCDDADILILALREQRLGESAAVTFPAVLFFLSDQSQERRRRKQVRLFCDSRRMFEVCPGAVFVITPSSETITIV